MRQSYQSGKSIIYRPALWILINSLFLFAILFASALFTSTSALADTQLYACTKNGETTLQANDPGDCDQLKTYHYQSVKPGIAPKFPTAVLGTAPVITPEVMINRYQNVDERVGRALTIQQDDRRVDQCFFYKSRIADSVVVLERQADDALQVRRLVPQIERDKAQYRYYCGRPY